VIVRNHIFKYKKNVLIVVSVILLLALILGVGFYSFVLNNSPKDLNSDLKYAGKKDYGCLLLCDSVPGSTYFYATNTSEEKFKQSFKDARVISVDSGVDSNNAYHVIGFTAPNKQGDATFYINFYESYEGNIASRQAKHMISFSSSDYELIKEMLE
jgi:hypothetical protein